MNVFACSVLKVNTSLNTVLKISFSSVDNGQCSGRRSHTLFSATPLVETDSTDLVQTYPEIGICEKCLAKKS